MINREDVNDDDEIIEAVKKMISDNSRIRDVADAIRDVADDVWHIVRLIPSKFDGCFRHETCSSEDYSKIAKTMITRQHTHRCVY